MKKIYEINDISRILRPIFVSYNVNSVLLFGSYAKNKADENSDIDLYVDGTLTGLTFCAMCEDVKEIIGKDVDMFQSNEIKPNSEMLKNIKKEGISIYERE